MIVGTKFYQTHTILIFLEQIYPKRVFPGQNWKNKCYRHIQHTQVSLSTIFTV